MVVSAEETWGSIGGGNVEAVAVSRARALLAEFATEPTTFTANLSDKAPVEHGVQCCGGEVTVLLDPLLVLPAVAIFGVGHVGLELARILARHELDLHLVDSRPQQLSDAVLAPLADATARIHTHHVPVLPELVLGELPSRQLRAGDDSRPCRGCRPDRRRAAHRPPWLDRADRLVGQVDPVP